MFFKVIILTVQAIKRAGIVKDSQVFIAVLRTAGNGISRVTAPLAACTDKICYTVRGKRIIVGGQVPFMGSSSLEFAGFDAAKAAKACASLGYPAPVDAKSTGDAICCAGRIDGESVRSAAVIVNGLDFWPDLVKMRPDAIGTEADYLRDGLSGLAAVLTCTHKAYVRRLSATPRSSSLVKGKKRVYP